MALNKSDEEAAVNWHCLSNTNSGQLFIFNVDLIFQRSALFYCSKAMSTVMYLEK